MGGSGLAVGGMTTGYLGFVSMLAAVSVYMYMEQNKNHADDDAVKQCAANAETIARACKAYAADHRGNFPSQLDDLVPQYLPDKTVFSSPIPVPGASQPEIGYRYFGGKSTDPADQVLLISLGTTANHLKVLVFIDGSSRVVKDSEVQLVQ
jgi:hypothetical protein